MSWDESKDAPKVCPFCGEDVTNGVGPDDFPELTKLLNHLPSSHLFKEAANWHDYWYHIGKTEDDRKVADDSFYKAMVAKISPDFPWYLNGFYRLQAFRNYWLVQRLGGLFFNYAGCNKTLSGTDSDQTA